MPYYGSSTGAEFGAGVNHLTTGRTNEFSHTLGDPGLDETSDRWNSLTPRGVLATTAGGSEDTGFEAVAREQGAYQPGETPKMQDELSDGSDNQD